MKGRAAANRAKIGEKYNRLTIIADSGGRDKNGAILWSCKCDCGTTTNVRVAELRANKIKSCGCLNRFRRSERRLPKGEVTLRGLECRYKASAKRRGHSYDLSYEQFKSLVIKPCYYCGSPPKSFNIYLKADGKRARPDIVSESLVDWAFSEVGGIDRIESDKGYEVDNCRSCCTKCNLMKRDYTENSFLDHIKKIIKHVGDMNE